MGQVILKLLEVGKDLLAKVQQPRMIFEIDVQKKKKHCDALQNSEPRKVLLLVWPIRKRDCKTSYSGHKIRTVTSLYLEQE